MNFKSIHHLSIIAIGTMAIFAANAKAQIIYADSLIGSGAISGTMPSTDTGSATWTAEFYGPVKTANGIYAFNNIPVAGYLPLTVDGTGIYTLTVTSFTPSTSNEGMTFGFINSSQSINGNLSATTAPAYVSIIGGQGTPIATDVYGGSTGGTTSSSFDTAHVFSISLDSSTGTLTFSQDGTAYETVSSALTSLQMSTITGIGFGFGYTNSTTSTFSNFSLTETAAVPEPSTYVLMLVALAVLVVMGRRKHLLS